MINYLMADQSIGEFLRGLEESSQHTELDSADETHPASDPQLISLNISLVDLLSNPDQPRQHFAHEQMSWLTESIAKHGVLQPILVRPIQNGKYAIIAGERRYRAAKKLGLRSIPAVTASEATKHLDEVEIEALALIENLQRSNLNDYELAMGVTDQVRQRLGFTNLDETAKFLRRVHNNTLRPEDQQYVDETESIFRQFGLKLTSFVTTQLNVLSLDPHLQRGLRLGVIDLSKARILNRIKDQNTLHFVTDQTVDQKLTTAQLRREVNDILKKRTHKHEEELRRVEIAHNLTAFRKAYVKRRRKLPAKTIDHIEELLAQLNALVMANPEQATQDIQDEDSEAA